MRPRHPLCGLHGAWHQPAHLDDVVERLRSGRVEVTAPDLAGLSLVESTLLVQDLIDAAPEPPLVLAHSFGAVTATGVQGAHHLILLAGFVFDVDENPMSWIEQVQRETGRPAAPLPLVVDEHGMTSIDPVGAQDGLFADCPSQVAERAIALLRPEPEPIFVEAPTRAAWRDTPSTYVACTEDRAIVPEMVARFAARCSTLVTWPGSHSPYLSRAEDVVALVRDRLA